MPSEILFPSEDAALSNSVAVTDGHINLTYQELHLKAIHIADQLYKLGIQREEPVGIIVQHGVADIVAQIATVYAGVSCTPMDPNLPDIQIKRRLDNLRTRFVLVDESNVKPELSYTQINIDDCTLWAAKDSWAAESIWATDPKMPVLTTLEHRTHLIHTSGTTSEPKAVQIAARSILQVVYHAPFEPVGSTDIVAHINNTSFDVSLFDIWVPLIRGARIAVLSKVTLLDLPAMSAAIEKMGITVMTTTTALLNLAAKTHPNAFSGLKTCFIGGEAANVAAIETIFKYGPPQQLINAYGPTETCIFCLAHRITNDDLQMGSVSIGKPIGKTVAYICDESGEPVVEGEEGELWIGGAGVSPGYVNHPEKKPSSFVTWNTAKTSLRLYRTGDRGYRIELEAVEMAMLRTGQFTEAVALKVEASQGAGSILVAFAVPVSSKEPHPGNAAIESLKTMLPDYMVPRIELISQMPLNSHAKIDRKLLTQLYRDRWNQVRSNGLTGDTQEKLALLWTDILGLQSLPGKEKADFFHLGATSLQASLLISQIRKHFDADISLLTLYDHPRIGELAATIDNSREHSLGTTRNEQAVWIQDTKIADDLVSPSAPVIDWRRDTEGRVFLSGATGFVGAFLLANLLRMREVHQVGCLVRAESPQVGLNRIKLAMGKYGQWEERFSDKILVLCGSLEDLYLGLGYERFHEIASWASVIFHLGARVNYTQPYSLHRPANVVGTRNIVRLGTAGNQTKAIHYVSSISCFGPTGFVTGTDHIAEDEPLLKHIEALTFDHGYAQSQWVAETMLRRLIDCGFPIAIYRPGFITGHSQSGACNPDDFFSRLIHSCVEMQSYPLLPNQRKEFVPVNYVNAAILHIASTPYSLGHAYHIVPPSPICLD
ncbi:uncharacterized protein N7477_007321 [Penicillium maclennaniae]|uniref:uncharacterized protein n=1 Tax=Penicillium maclennaniae TaxID=1343394 RepID=UPI002540188B|nr:uncharacterized protein N7477_007321 [Penicillium maclennaniae]KAJ5664873.1 hypothetical protein N7477_007321 [Penicillium maclennaniae]